MGAGPAVSVIIPTLGLHERAASLQAAIESVLDQAGVCPAVIVVLNGRERCPDVERALRENRRVRLLVRESRGLPAALAAGRAMVEAEWFTALDDDDLLLPGALALRVQALEGRGDCAAVITNGYLRTGDRDVLHMRAGHGVSADPLRAMLEKNWCLPGSWMCRASMVGIDVFEEMPSFLECTYLAMRIACEHPVLWLDEPTVVYRVGSPGAESLSRAYVLGQVRALRRIIALNLPDDVRRDLRTRIAGAYHSASDHERASGAMGEAWWWHAASLLQPSGWRYLSFTRHLIRDTVRPRV
jgi:glycosyltransferase involved in cell wall biosynthesis